MVIIIELGEEKNKSDYTSWIIKRYSDTHKEELINESFIHFKTSKNTLPTDNYYRHSSETTLST